MSRVDDLIAELCPTGVPVRALGDVGTFTRGNGLQKKDLVDDGIGAIHYGQIYTFYGTSATETKSYVTRESAGRLRKAQPGDLVVTTTSENIDDVGKAVAWLGEDEIAVGGHSSVYAHTLDPMYAAYFFQTESFHRQKARYARGTKVKELAGDDLARITIPVPPLGVQRAIATILEKFESLEAELEAELEARRRQYEYYRHALLTFSEDAGVPQVLMSEITTSVASGRNKVRSNEGKYPVYGSTGLLGFSDDYAYSGDALLVARVGANAGRVNAVSGNFDVSDNTLVIKPTGEWTVRFAFHQLTHMDINQYAIGGGQPLVTGGLLKSLSIELPSVPEQKRIADTLDKFDALVHNLSVGLPAELRARRQQYEYYRDKLLTFQEPV